MNKKAIALIFFIVGVVFIAGCRSKVTSDKDVWLETEDNFKVRASVWYSEGDKAVILVHMLDHDRGDWVYFADDLKKSGITSIGIDLRGHGESDGNWRMFNDKDFNSMVNDIEAAKKELKKEGKISIGIVGASIGSNLAVKYAAEDKDIKAVVLLSPGINYKGIDISSNMTDFDTPAFIAVSKEDAYSFESSNLINEKIIGEKVLFIGQNLGHGTDMLPKSEDLRNRIINFLNKNMK